MVHLQHAADSQTDDTQDSSEASSTSLRPQHSGESEPLAKTSELAESSKPPLPHSKSDIELRFSQGPVRRPKPKTHSRTPSSSKVALARPHLNRSKSTDGVVRVKRNNRSFTKLSNLQPLTKTLSNQSLKSNKSNTSLKNLNLNYGGLKISTKSGKAILSLNDPDDDNFEDLSDAEAVEPAPPALVPLQQVFQQALEPAGLIKTIAEEAKSPEQEQGPELVQTESPVKPVPAKISESPEISARPEVSVSPEAKASPVKETAIRPYDGLINVRTQDSTDDLVNSSNLYGGSLLLSQSTGLVRKLDSKQRPPEVQESSLGSQPESVSGISFKANPIDVHNIAAPITTNKTIIKENSYQPNQTIFNNLQRTTSQYATTKKLQQLQSQQLQRIVSGDTTPNAPKDLNGQNNFANFLNANANTNDDNDTSTRTQQRLWLQRENSLMDVNLDPNQLSNFSNLSLNKLMFAHNYNQSSTNLQFPATPSAGAGSGPSVTPPDHSGSATNVNGLLHMFNGQPNLVQSRIEFERLNREYLNVRRYLNPAGESLNRVKNNTIHIGKNGRKDEPEHYANTFEEFSPEFGAKEAEITAALAKMWQESLVAKPAAPKGPFPQSPKQITRPQMQRIPSNTQFMNARGATPTTRKLAVAQAQAAAQADRLQK